MKLSKKDHKEDDPLGLQYMSQVDVALHQKGHPYAFLLSVAVLVFFLVFLLWASFAKIAEVRRGQGHVTTAEGINPVQSERGGTIEQILVKENDHVTRDQLLVRISNVQEVSTLRDLQNKNIELTLSILRLEAESKEGSLVFSDDLKSRYPSAVRAQEQLYLNRQQQFVGENIQLDAQIEQRKREAQEAKERLAKLENELALVVEQDSKVKPLVDRGSYSKNDYLELQQKRLSLEGDRDSTVQTIAKAENGIIAAEERKNARIAERQASIAEELNNNRIEQAKNQEQLKVGGHQVDNTELKAPIDGTVKQVLLKEGAVAKPAETILELIPENGMLEVEAKFHPEDRGFLYVGQNAMVKFDGYDFSIYGGLEASITRISQDTIDDKKGEPWYEVRFVTKHKNLMYQGKALEIHPGMTVMVDVLTDRRTVLDLILRPILQAKDNAMTER